MDRGTLLAATGFVLVGGLVTGFAIPWRRRYAAAHGAPRPFGARRPGRKKPGLELSGRDLPVLVGVLLVASGPRVAASVLVPPWWLVAAISAGFFLTATGLGLTWARVVRRRGEARVPRWEKWLVIVVVFASVLAGWGALGALKVS